MWQYNNTDELYHHGILGMKWGVRRYQNKDGSLTPAGKKKAAKMKDEYTALTGKRLNRKPTPKSEQSTNKTKAKSIKEMSDTELRDRINRLQMEKQAKGLQNDLSSNGSKFVSSVGKDVVAPAAKEAGKRLLTDLFMKIGKDKLGLNQEQAKDVLADLKKEVDEMELKKRKSVAEDYFKKREQREANNNSKSNNTKQDSSKSRTTDTVDFEFVKEKKKQKETTKKKKDDIIDAEWYETPSSSRDIVPYRYNGKSFIDELFR